MANDFWRHYAGDLPAKSKVPMYVAAGVMIVWGAVLPILGILQLVQTAA